MRIIRFTDDAGKVHFGEVRDKGIAERLEGDLYAGLQHTGELVPIDRLEAPLEPSNIYCIGMNYQAHAKEVGQPVPEDPVVIMKPTTAVIGPGMPIRIPNACEYGPEVDYECELAVVIGKSGRDIPESQAMEHVLGYTCANDVSARRWQKHNGGQWIRAKSFDTFCPLGPSLVTSDEIPDPHTLGIRTLVNGTLMQDSNTSDMIFSLARVISFLSRDTLLRTGTVISTGTPEGVGFTRNPPVFLEPGDEVTITIDGIGELTNPVQ